jgi:hypothetical protein
VKKGPPAHREQLLNAQIFVSIKAVTAAESTGEDERRSFLLTGDRGASEPRLSSPSRDVRAYVEKMREMEKAASDARDGNMGRKYR